ncbi:patatin-like phospholipase domain-containing protein [Flagelloscypha sp. PMI_526]|nr:patatin-like phospholipase domain-containing protein [Flagelloscypha sp. PMI_526]
MALDREERFVDPSHIEAFRQALNADDLPPDVAADGLDDLASPGGLLPGSMRVRKVSALSDFAPVNMRIKRRSRKKPHLKRHNDKRSDYMYFLLRWPLLFFISLFIAGEFSLYIIIRQLVNAKEWVTAWRGRKGALRKKLRASKTYDEWKAAALELDAYLHFDEWKAVEEDPFYDWKLVRKVKASLSALRTNKDARGVLGVLETCLRNNFAGVESPRLYSETYYKTKDLIEEYIDELELSLDFIRTTQDLSNEEKRKFFRSANTNLGTSSLSLSGGSTFSYYHFGTVKALLDANLIPRVVTGTSAGGLIAALVCTHTNEELKHLIVPELASKISAFEESSTVVLKRLFRTGALFDAVSWAEKSAFFTRGSLTFKEAYLRTGRVLCISVTPSDRHSPTKLLNYITAPDTVIWSSLLASAAVPSILNPVVLMAKQKDGTIAPWNWGSRFKDGSLRVDIPVQELNLYFNVTQPIVSQANPHVHLFFFAPRGSAGIEISCPQLKGWRGNFLLSAAEQWLKHELTKNFKVIRDLELMPELLGQDWSSVFLQRFSGSITIWPRTRLKDWFRLLTDPDEKELARMTSVGQLVTWPKLHMIQNRLRIEHKILAGRQAVRKTMRPKTGRVNGVMAVRPPREAEMNDGTTADPTGTDVNPLSLETDANPVSQEADMDLSRSMASRRHRRSRQGSIDTDNAPLFDPIRPPARRKWSSHIVTPSNEIEMYT